MMMFLHTQMTSDDKPWIYSPCQFNLYGAPSLLWPFSVSSLRLPPPLPSPVSFLQGWVTYLQDMITYVLELSIQCQSISLVCQAATFYTFTKFGCTCKGGIAVMHTAVAVQWDRFSGKRGNGRKRVSLCECLPDRQTRTQTDTGRER